MPSRRMAKMAEAIRETVSTTVLFELKDPRVRNVTVLSAEVAGDLRSAKVYVSVMGDAKTQALTMHGLESARGFLQAKIADRLQTRYTPILTFVLDQGVKKSLEASKLLKEALPPSDDAVECDDDEVDAVSADDERADDERDGDEGDPNEQSVDS